MFAYWAKFFNWYRSAHSFERFEYFFSTSQSFLNAVFRKVGDSIAAIQIAEFDQSNIMLFVL